jgi:nucleoprotein TPR
MLGYLHDFPLIENTRSSLESELQNAKSSSSFSTSEAQTLRSRVLTLESSNRDTVSLLEAKCTAYDRLSEELSTQQQKSIESRREISELEQAVQTAQLAATRAKFKEENFQSEIDRLTSNNEFLSEELKTKTAEYLKYRKEKGARIAELERLKEEAESSSESHKRTEESLRTRLQELTHKYDESIAKIQEYEDQVVNAEQSFRTELAATSRLADLWEESAKSAKERIKELETTVEELREGESEAIGRLRAEADTERTEKESAEQRIADLEEQVEKLESDIVALQHVSSLPGTPRRGVNGSSTPQLHREGSEVFSPGSSTRNKGGLNLTQLYAEYTTTKAELVAERRRNERLSATIDDMVQDLESKGPEIQEMKSENERLQLEIIEISSMLDDSHKERDRARKEARRWEGEVEGSRREGDVLRQQLRDLSVQVKILLSEIHIRDEGLDEISAVQRAQLESIVRGEMDEDEGMTDTDRFINQHLTIFKNIRELQEQNVNLLKITRELGQKMENEEALMKKSQLAEEKEELDRLRTRVEKYKDEIKTMMATSQSYIKERDMFRRMLQNRGQLPPSTDLGSLFGQSVQPATPSRSGLVPTVEQTPGAKEAAENASLLRELQAHFDSYREEAATDRRTLKDQTERLSRERGELQAQLARANSQLTLATERFEMLQANYNMLKNENLELQKRSQMLSESAAKQDVRTQQVAEDLVEARSMIESMRTEAANLKAEKTLFKSIEQRMSQDNESLRNERARLNTLIANLEKLQNQRELSETEMRNKLESQRQTLESELQITRRKLEAETEEGKRAVLRKEYDAQQNQKRIDDLVTTLGAVREELAGAKTMKDHLQARVDELTIELKSAEEKVQALHPRATPRPNANPGAEVNEIDDDALSREQELAMEVSELKRDLDLATSQLEGLKTDVESYKEISQAAEDGLQSMNETHDQYREEMDRIVEEKDAKIRDLERRVEDISTELSNINNQLSATQTEAAEKARRDEEEKLVLESEIVRLKDEGERYAMTAEFHQEDLRTQATIAQEAQGNYERELVKHADAAKALQKIRSDYNELKAKTLGLQTEAEAAKAALTQGEENWGDMRENYEKELSEMRARRDDLISQNKTLHQQLEAFSSQVAALQQSRAANDVEGEGTLDGTPSGPDSSVGEFQKIIRYLRREKEIVDVQCELAVQESKRLKKQLDYTQSQLDETRLKLEQERRSQADGGRSSAAHKDLMEKLTELNLIRESSVTLRNEARVAREQLEERSRKVEELLAQIQPLELRVREMENQLEVQEGEMKLLREDRDRWQQRNQQILQKYDRIDPAEMESLRTRIATVQKERDELAAEKESFEALKEEVASIPEKIRVAQEEAITPWRQRQEKLIEQTKERLRSVRLQLADKVTEFDTAVKEKETLELQLTATKQELETIKSRGGEPLATEGILQSPQQTHAPEVVMHNGFEEGQVAEDQQQRAGLSEQERNALEERIRIAENKAREQEEMVRHLQDAALAHQQKVEELNREVVSHSLD